MCEKLFESGCATLKEKEQQEEDIEAPQMSNVPHPSIDCFRYFVCVFVFALSLSLPLSLYSCALKIFE